MKINHIPILLFFCFITNSQASWDMERDVTQQEGLDKVYVISAEKEDAASKRIKFTISVNQQRLLEKIKKNSYTWNNSVINAWGELNGKKEFLFQFDLKMLDSKGTRSATFELNSKIAQNAVIVMYVEPIVREGDAAGFNYVIALGKWMEVHKVH